MTPDSPPRRVAITGLGTFTGRRLAERLLERDPACEVFALDVRLPPRLEGRVAFRELDLLKPDADGRVADVLRKEECDAVVHAAFVTSPDPDVARQHELQVIGSLHLLDGVAAAGVSKLVVASTAEVYGARPDNPQYLTEAHPLRPSPRAHAVADRAELEGLLRVFAQRHPEVAVASLRPCWIAGPTCDTRVTRWYDGGRLRRPLGHDPLMQLLHEDDWLRALECALAGDARGAFNLAGRDALPLSRLLGLARARALSLPAALLYRLELLPALSSAGEPPEAFYDYLRYVWLVDTARARDELGFEPVYSTKEAWLSAVVARRLRGYR